MASWEEGKQSRGSEVAAWPAAGEGAGEGEGRVAGYGLAPGSAGCTLDVWGHFGVKDGVCTLRELCSLAAS